MAFKDNSGTIIIDAVLTDEGRKRMANGSFRVTRFALGDDEIDYGLIDVEAASFTKVVLQPLLEAHSAENATINHGLENFHSDTLMYLPVIKVNEKLSAAVKAYPRNYKGGEEEYYYISVNEETSEKLAELFGTNIYYLENQSVERNRLFFESGIDNDYPQRDKIGRERYILNYNLLDRYFIINCDNRFVEKLLLVQGRASHFENDKDNILYSDFTSLREVPSISYGSVLKHFSPYIGVGIDNLIYNYGSSDDNDYSAIAGPRGTICAINFKLKPELTVTKDVATDFRYSKFGATNQILFGGSDKFDYIDTAVHVEGFSSSSKLTIPLRILRYAGT